MRVFLRDLISVLTIALNVLNVIESSLDKLHPISFG